MRHPIFIARTVLVKNNDVEDAVKLLNRILGREGLIEQHKRQERYEKPTHVRSRINYERCRAIYNEDMTRKIQFISRQNRVDPFPGCS